MAYGTHTTRGQRRATAVRSGNTSARWANSAGQNVHANKNSSVKRCVPERSQEPTLTTTAVRQKVRNSRVVGAPGRRSATRAPRPRTRMPDSRLSTTKCLNVRSVISRLTISSSTRSEEHTSELQSPCNLVCRLLLEKKKTAAQEGRHVCPQRRSL